MSKNAGEMPTLVVFNPVVGDFLVKNEKSDAALAKARAEIGDAAWKAGFSKEKSVKVLGMLAADDIYPIIVTGTLRRVNEDMTHDGRGNDYAKVRIFLEDPLESIMVSLEAGREETMIIVQALVNAEPGEVITLVPSQEVAKRGDRTFYNHRCKIVRGDGKLVPQMAGAWRHAQDAADVATQPLRANPNPSATLKKTINLMMAEAKVEFHMGLLRDKIAPRFQ